MHISCPHCHNPIELVTATSSEDVLCPACGSTFRLEGDATAAWGLREEQRTLGRFELLAVVGTGAFGTVYRARDPELDREVAIKVPRSGNVANGQELDRFLREARSVAQLRHPSIVPVHEVGKQDGVPYLVSDFVRGLNLADMLTGRQPSVREAAQLLATVADALQYAHGRGVVHRDVKPSNIMLDEAGQPHVMDFGLAKRDAGEIAMTVEGSVLGTPAYMSPEQARGEAHRVDGRSDVYSLGVVLYQLLTGEPPFRGNMRMLLHQVLHDDPRAPRSLNDRIPRDLETISLKAMAKEPGRRYQQAGELADDLRRFLAGQPIQARPVSRVERCVRWCRRNPALAATGGFAAAALIAVAVVSIVFAMHEGQAAESLRQEQQKTAAALNTSDEQRRRAETALSDVLTERARANENRRALDLLSAIEALDKGWVLADKGEADKGLLWLAHSLEIAPADAADLQRVIRANLGAWGRRLHPLRAVLGEPATAEQSYALKSQFAFSPDGRSAVTASKIGVPQIWDVATGKLVGELVGHHGPVHAVAFSPDGKWILSGGEDRTARLWDAETKRQVAEPLAHSGPILAVAFSPDRDAKIIATGGDDHVAKLWQRVSRSRIGADLRHTERIVSIAFSPDGETVLTRGHDNAARLWTAATGKQIGATLQHNKSVYVAVFSADGRTILTSSGDSTARLWDAATGKPIGDPLEHPGPVTAAAFSPDGKSFLTGTQDVTGTRKAVARFWDTDTRKLIDERGPQDENVFDVVAFSPDGSMAATNGSGGIAQLWDVATREQLGPPLRHRSGVWDVRFSPDSRALLTWSHGDFVRLWAVNPPSSAGTSLPHPHAVAAVAFSPDGGTILTGGGLLSGKKGDARLWHAMTRQPLGEPLPHPYPVVAAAFNHDGTRFLTGAGHPLFGKGEAQLWDTATHAKIGTPLAHDRVVLGVAFSRDGQTMATASRDGTARLREVASGKELILKHTVGVTAVTFSPDGTTLLTGTEHLNAYLWDRASGRVTEPSFKHTAAVLGVAFSRDGKTVLTGSANRTAQRWDAGTGKALGAALQHQGWVRGVAFSPDPESRFIVTGSVDKTARLWDAATGKPIGPPMRHEFWVVAAVFSPDGRTVLTGGGDPLSGKGESRLWDVPLPVEGDARRIALWAQVITGMQLDASGLSLLDAPTWQQRHRQLEALGGPLLP